MTSKPTADTKQADIFQQRAAAKARVVEIEQKKLTHLKTIEAKENELANLKSSKTDNSLDAAAAAFFRGESVDASNTSLESEIRKLREQIPLFDVEIKNRKKMLNAIASDYQAAVWARIKPRDDANKKAMAELFIKLSKCCAVEMEHLAEFDDADTTPPAEFRIMRPDCGVVDDPNSRISLWLRELREFYPHLKV